MTTERKGRFKADGLPVLIGSVPLASHQEALDWIFSATPEIPLWPQLPVNPLERMLPQFVEGLPCVVEETEAGTDDSRICFDTTRPGFDEEMLAFYEDFLAVQENAALLTDSRFQVSRERANGLYLLVEKLRARHDVIAVKGQVTGPFTMLTGIKDQKGRAGYFDETARDMVVKGISLKAAWQARFLADRSERQILLFIDEPALAGLGSSAFISVNSDAIRDLINEVASAVHREGALAGIHVCANTDWNLLLSSEIDILSFDAYGFFDRIAPLRNEVSAFFDRGGIIAWGGIPTSKAEDIANETTESLARMWETQMDAFAGAGWDKEALLARTLITPSCGTGSLEPRLAAKVLELTGSVAAALRKTYGK